MGPVSSFETRFLCADSCNYNVSGQVTPRAVACSLQRWVRHNIETGHRGIDGHGGLYPADFDGDGDLDMAGYMSLACSMAFYRNYMVEYDSVDYRRARIYGTPSGTKGKYAQTWAGCFDADNKPDVFVCCSTRVFWYKNQSTGPGDFTFELRPIASVIHTRGGVECADINRDGLMDLVLGDRPLEVWYQQMNGSFLRETVWAGESYKILVGNVNNDSWPDLLAEDQLFINNNGHFPHTPTWRANLTGPDGIWIRDFDNDGLPDLLICDQWSTSTPGIYWYENLGTGTSFRQHIVYRANDADDYGDGACAEDVDGDNMADVIGDYSKVGFFRQINSDSFVKIQLDTITDSHWIRTANLDYRPNGPDADIDAYATGKWKFVWYENQIQSRYSRKCTLVSSVLNVHKPVVWRYLNWNAIRHYTTTIQFYVRSGKSLSELQGRLWSSPMTVSIGRQVDSAGLASRTTEGDSLFQYKLTMVGGDSCPVVYSVGVNYDMIDAQTVAILAPTGTVELNETIAPRATVRNNGTAEATFNVRFRISDGYVAEQTVSRLAPNATVTCTFPGWPAATAGIFTTTCSTMLAHDLVLSNNKVTGSVTVRSTDVQTVSIITPTGAVNEGTVIQPQATVRNNGTSTVTFPVKFSISDGYSNTQNVSNLAPGATVTVTFADWTAGQRGTFITKCSTGMSGDMVPANDKVSGTVAVQLHDIQAISITAPTERCNWRDTIVPEAWVRNNGNVTEVFPVRFIIQGGYQQEKLCTLAGGATATLQFPAWRADSLDTLVTRCTTMLAGDMNPNNNRVTGKVFVQRLDARAIAIVTPVGEIQQGVGVTPEATVLNSGNVTETFRVMFRINSTPVWADTQLVTNLQKNRGLSLTFDSYTPNAPGTFETKCSTMLVGDVDPANDATEGSFVVHGFDVQPTAILAPVGYVVLGDSATPRATVKNNGTTRVTFLATFRIGSDYFDTLTVVDLDSSAERNISFRPWTAGTAGLLVTRCSVQLVGDQNPGNDTISGTVFVQRLDVGTVEIIAADTVQSGDRVNIRIRVCNYGNSTVSFPVRFSVPGDTCFEATVEALAADETTTVVFHDWVPRRLGLQTLRCSTMLAGDMESSNDALERPIYVTQGPIRDMSVDAILYPVDTVDYYELVTPVAVITNRGTIAHTSTVNFSIGTNLSQLTRTLNPGESDTVRFDAQLMWQAGPQPMCCSIVTPDANLDNNFIRGSVYVATCDAGVHEILRPVGIIGLDTCSPKARIFNSGERQNPITVTLRILGTSYFDTLHIPEGIVPGCSLDVTFDPWQPVVDTFPVRCSVFTPGDLNRRNDVAQCTVYVSPERIIDVAARAITCPTAITIAGCVTPAAKVRNEGTVRSLTRVSFSIPGTVYSEVVELEGGLPEIDTTIRFRDWLAEVGEYTARCSVWAAEDINPANDTVSLAFEVIDPPPEGWVRKADVPAGPKNRKVGNGGALAYLEVQGKPRIYALKGNGTREVYYYNQEDTCWYRGDSLPAIGRSGRSTKVKKGGTLVSADGKLYATKGGRTLEYWCFDPALSGTERAWEEVTEVPLGFGKKVDAGAAATTAVVGDEVVIYLLKGCKTCEFYRYTPSTRVWQPMADLPFGVNGKGAAGGTALVADGNGLIYALKGGGNEHYSYDMAYGIWTTRDIIPILGRKGKKTKMKDGGSLVHALGDQWAFKGGNTQEYWKFQTACDSWIEKHELPNYDNKRIKGGGSLVYSPWNRKIYGMKGGGTFHFAMYLLTYPGPCAMPEIGTHPAAQGVTLGPERPDPNILEDVVR